MQPTERKGDVEKGYSSEPCPICFDDMQEKHYSECKHAFHKECLLEWLKHHQTCPICRAVLVCETGSTEGAEQPPLSTCLLFTVPVLASISVIAVSSVINFCLFIFVLPAIHLQYIRYVTIAAIAISECVAAAAVLGASGISSYR
jgi:hypothetical protein